MDWRFSTFLLLLSALLLGITWATSQDGLCHSKFVLDVLSLQNKDGALNCFEFWFNRYQTLAAAIIAFATAAIAIRPALAQLAEMRRQSLQKTFDSLRTRGEEIEATKEFFWKVNSKIYLIHGASFGVLDSGKDAIITEKSFSEFDAAVSELVEASENLPANIGPAWGDAKTREIRRNLLRELNNFAFIAVDARSRARKIMDSRRMSYPAEEKVRELKPCPAAIREKLDEVRRFGSEFYQSLEIEERRVSTLLASLEPHVLS